MAVLDDARGVVVVRIVYDGPPRSGKTTSVNALAASLGKEVYCPEQRNGRTTFFDWMDYTGGLFEGYQIRCQILSVPGQLALAARRDAIIRDADAIVFVADTSPQGLAESLERLRELPSSLRELPAPPIGVIVQANKRDASTDDALDSVRATIAGAGLSAGVTESIAAEGSGVRETFVFAVRLALDRVRELLRDGSLHRGKPALDDGRDLFESMKIVRGPELVAGVDDVQPDPPVRIAGDERPAPPSVDVPSGAIWPPVEGRVILHEATASGLRTHHQLGDGSWVAGIGGGWRVCSARDDELSSFEAGRSALIDWARLHVACAAYLSSTRCIVLSRARAGAWRLWQIIRARPALRALVDGVDQLAPEEAAARLLEAAQLLVHMQAATAAAPCDLPCTLDTIGRSELGPVFIGPMPRTPASTRRQALNIVADQLSPVLADAAPHRRAALHASLAGARARMFGRFGLSGATDSLSQLLRS